jgi:Ni,Fe-hydrogenase maturation factor
LKVISLFQLDVALCDELRTADLAIFVDARDDDSDEPVVVRREVIDPQKIMASHSSHTCSINGLLNITSNLYGATPECLAVLPKAYEFSFKEGLSARANDTARLASERIRRIIRQWRSGQEVLPATKTGLHCPQV